MVRNGRYGDDVASSSRPSLPVARCLSQSFTAGSNPNSAPMPNFSGQRRHRRSQPSSPGSLKRSYSPLPEPSFDLLSSAAPSLFGDMSHQVSLQSFTQHPSSNHMDPPAACYDVSGLPAIGFLGSFDNSAENPLAHGMPESEPDPNAYHITEFAAVGAPVVSFSRPAPAPDATKLHSPFISKGPMLAPPFSSRLAAATDSVNKKSPQTPRKIIRSKSVAPASRSQPLLPAPSCVKTTPRPLGQRDPNANSMKRCQPDSPTLEKPSPRKAYKKSKLDEPGRHRETVPIPDAESFPAVDPGVENSKPPYTYAQMIALAIWKAPGRRRTLAQIYDFIRTTWCYYRKDDTWENSIRHNLSLHKKFFEKQARAKDDKGKGNYWLIIAGNERELLDVYLRERSGAETVMPGKNTALASCSRLEPLSFPASNEEPTIPISPSNLQLQLSPIPNMQSTAPALPEPSSDATIPASDHIYEESEAVKHQQGCRLLDAALSSSPPAISGHVTIPDDTPTRTAGALTYSGRTSGKRKRYSMVDSGYMTGIESSILRYGQQRSSVLSSEADAQQFQGGGRAEDAIRKLRASSPLSPSKSKPCSLPPFSHSVSKGPPPRRGASPSGHAVPAKTTVHGKKSVARLTGATTLAPPKTKTSSKYNTSPMRQHDKLRASVREMLETPQQVRDYDKKFPPKHRASFAIWEDDALAPESDSPLANSAGRMLDEILSEKRNRRPATSPFKFTSPLKAFLPFPPMEGNTASSHTSPSKVVSSPSKYLPPISKPSGHDSENWLVTENNASADVHLDLELFGSDDSNSLDLTQTFRSIGEIPAGAESYGPATLHRFC